MNSILQGPWPISYPSLPLFACWRKLFAVTTFVSNLHVSIPSIPCRPLPWTLVHADWVQFLGHSSERPACEYNHTVIFKSLTLTNPFSPPLPVRDLLACAGISRSWRQSILEYLSFLPDNLVSRILVFPSSLLAPGPMEGANIHCHMHLAGNCSVFSIHGRKLMQAKEIRWLWGTTFDITLAKDVFDRPGREIIGIVRVQSAKNSSFRWLTHKWREDVFQIYTTKGDKLVEVAHMKYRGSDLIQKELILTPFGQPQMEGRQSFVNRPPPDYEGWNERNGRYRYASPVNCCSFRLRLWVQVTIMLEGSVRRNVTLTR